MGSNTHKLGPHSRPHRFWKLDGRTREAKRAQQLRDELTAHVGGKPSVAQRLLIERSAVLIIRLELMDRADMTMPATPRDTREFFYVQNTLTRTLKALGMEGVPERVPTIDDILTSHARGVAA